MWSTSSPSTGIRPARIWTRPCRTARQWSTTRRCTRACSTRAALREAGFADGQPDPPDGVLGRDGQGRLTGVLFEGPMFRVFARPAPARPGATWTRPRGRRVVRRAGQRLAALGITAACDADMRCQTLAAYAEADDAGVLAQRIYGLTVHDEVDELIRSGLQGRRSGRLAAQAVKIWADGGMSSRTAAIHGTYPVPPFGSGILYFTPAELTAMVRDFAARGLQVCVHAQGDRAIEIVLDAYAQSLARRRETRAGTASSTAAPCTRALTARAARAADPGGQPAGVPVRPGRRVRRGVRRQADQLYAFRSWQRAGITVAGSSDAPVITPDPLTGIRDAILRRTAAGQVIGPDERLAARDALALYTAGGAYAMHRETRSARWSRASSPTSPSWTATRSRPGADPGIQVLATVVDGTPTYQAQTVLRTGTGELTVSRLAVHGVRPRRVMCDAWRRPARPPPTRRRPAGTSAGATCASWVQRHEPLGRGERQEPVDPAVPAGPAQAQDFRDPR